MAVHTRLSSIADVFTAWFVQIGALNEVHHLWQFADLEERRARREQSWSIPGWGETVWELLDLVNY